jgi:hypothetical protein
MSVVVADRPVTGVWYTTLLRFVRDRLSNDLAGLVLQGVVVVVVVTEASST